MGLKKKVIIGLSIMAVVATASIVSIASTTAKTIDAAVDTALETVQTIDKKEVIEMTNENLEEIDEDTLKTIKENWTVALFGVDSRDSKNLEGNSDVILLMSFNPNNGKMNLISVYRDTFMEISEGKYRKANAAFAYGGPKQAVDALNKNLDLEIDDYLAFNWTAVATAINELGGIDLEVTDKEMKYINGYITETVNSTKIPSTQLKKSGYQHLDGVQAVAYARIRYTDNDFVRTERQRTVIKLMLKKAKTLDINKLKSIVNNVLPLVSTSIDKDDIYTLLMNITRLNISDCKGFPYEPVIQDYHKGSYVFPSNMTEEVTKLHEDLYGETNYKPSKYVNAIASKSELAKY